jgi:hypothetical protein
VSRTAALLVLLAGCAATGADRPPPTPTARAAPGDADFEPEIVRAPRRFKMGSGEALARYPRGARCAGSDAPETVIGKPNQRNQTEVRRQRIIVYGFRFDQATLLIRCRGEVVETARLLR